MGQSPLEVFRETVAQLTAPGAAFAILDRDRPSKRRYAGTASNVGALLAKASAEHGAKDFIEYQGRLLTFGEVYAASEELALTLRHQYGIAPGDRVGIAMRNLPEWFIALFAILRVGGIAALLNSRGAAEEIVAAQDQVGCALVLADTERAGLLQGKTACPVLDVAAVDHSAAGTDGASLGDVPESGPDDPAIIIFTSGTTGRPKGATLTHHNLCIVAREIELRTETGLTMAAREAGMPLDTLRAMSAKPSPTLLITPMFHISGVVPLLGALVQGTKMIVMRRWDPVEALDLIEANAISSLSGPSMVFDDLLALPDASARMASLRNCAIAGQATPERLAGRIRTGNAQTGVSSNWGQTETSGAATAGTAAIFAGYPGTVGEAGTLVEIAAVGEDGQPVACGEVGELLVRGPIVMQGYWNEPEANARAFSGDWLRTGDLGRFDEHGLLYIEDRLKDMVISKGVNIYCAEVERVLSMLDGQREVALFGVADERLGERAVAAVVLQEDAAARLDEEAIRDHVRAHLADYKVPAEVRFDMGPLPRNGLGKVDKAALRRLYHERAPVRASN